MNEMATFCLSMELNCAKKMEDGLCMFLKVLANSEKAANAEGIAHYRSEFIREAL